MSANLALVTPQTQTVDTNAFQDYLRSNLTSDLVLQILEECLLQENSTYNSIDFEQALKDLQRKDSGRYHMLKVLMEGYATKEGMVMVDPKLVTASFKQRLKELELLKSMNWARRFCYRFGLAIKVLVGQMSRTQALQEAIQITGEVQIAKDELAVLELKRSQTARDMDKILTDVSSARRDIIEEANRRATEQTEVIYKESREAIAKERAELTKQLGFWHKAIDKAREEYGNINEQIAAARHKIPARSDSSWARLGGVSGFSGVSGYSGYLGVSGVYGAKSIDLESTDPDDTD